MSLVSTIFVLLAVLLLLLSVPVQLAIRSCGIDGYNTELSVRWLYGLIRFQVSLDTFADSQSSERTDDNPNRRIWLKNRCERKIGRKKKSESVFRSRLFYRRLFRLAMELLRAIHFREFSLRLRLGLDDPADTGRLWAWLGPLNATLQAVQHWQVNIEPDFMNAVVDYDLRSRIVFVPLQLVAVLVRFVLSLSLLLQVYAERRRHD